MRFYGSGTEVSLDSRKFSKEMGFYSSGSEVVA